MDRSESDVLVLEISINLARLAGSGELIAGKFIELIENQRHLARCLEAMSSELTAHFDVIEGVSR